MKNNVQTRLATMQDKAALANMVFGNCDPMQISVAKRDKTEEKYAQHINDENCHVVLAVNALDENDVMGFMVVKKEDEQLFVMEQVTQDNLFVEDALNLQLEQIINDARVQSVSMDHIQGAGAVFQGQFNKMMDTQKILEGVSGIVNGAFKMSFNQ